MNTLDLPQVKTKRTFELIVDLLKDKFISGEFSPGDRLPPERSLAEALGVGRPPVREAYRALELMGIIEIRKGNEGGAFILEPTNKSASEAISDLLRLHQVTLPTLAEARIFIEKGTAELAAQRITPKQLDQLEELLKRTEAKIEKGERVADLSLSFHLMIAEIAGNPVLTMALASLIELMRRFLRILSPDAETSRKELAEHIRLFTALKQGKGQEAGRLMDNHLRHSQSRLEKLAQSMPDKQGQL